MPAPLLEAHTDGCWHRGRGLQLSATWAKPLRRTVSKDICSNSWHSISMVVPKQPIHNYKSQWLLYIIGEDSMSHHIIDTLWSSVCLQILLHPPYAGTSINCSTKGFHLNGIYELVPSIWLDHFWLPATRLHRSSQKRFLGKSLILEGYNVREKPPRTSAYWQP